jgi:hypothetical protein
MFHDGNLFPIHQKLEGTGQGRHQYGGPFVSAQTLGEGLEDLHCRQIVLGVGSLHGGKV